MISVNATTLEDIHKASQDLQVIFKGENDVITNLIRQCHHNKTWTFSSEGKVGCIQGYMPMWSGLAWAGGAITNEIRNLPISYIRTVRRKLESQVKEDNIHRLEAYTKVGYTDGALWLEALGFEKESTLKSFGPDKSDYYLYRRLF